MPISATVTLAGDAVMRAVLVSALVVVFAAGCQPGKASADKPQSRSTEDLLAEAKALGMPTTKGELPNVPERPEDDQNAAAIFAQLADSHALYKHLSKAELNHLHTRANMGDAHLADANVTLKKAAPELKRIREAVKRPSSWFGQDLAVMIAYIDSYAFLAASAISNARAANQAQARTDLEDMMQIGRWLETNDGSRSEFLSRTTNRLFIAKAATRIAAEAKSKEDLDKLYTLVESDSLANSPADLINRAALWYYEGIQTFGPKEQEESLQVFLPMVITLLKEAEKGPQAVIAAAEGMASDDQNFTEQIVTLMQAWMSAEAHRETTLAYIDVMRARLQTGEFPAKLPGSHADPFNGKPLQYAVRNQGFRVWSVNKDLQDNEGAMSDEADTHDISYAYPVRDDSAWHVRREAPLN